MTKHKKKHRVKTNEITRKQKKITECYHQQKDFGEEIDSSPPQLAKNARNEFSHTLKAKPHDLVSCFLPYEQYIALPAHTAPCQ